MSQHPFDLEEIGVSDPRIADVGRRLEDYARDEAAAPPSDLVQRIQAAVDREPIPSGRWTAFTGALAGWGRPAKALAIVALLVAVTAGALVFGDLVQRARQQNVGTSPSPSALVSPTPSPTSSATPSPTPTPTPTPSTTPSAPASPSPTESNDDGRAETPEPTESDDHGGDDRETPEPSDDDNSGPGNGED